MSREFMKAEGDRSGVDTPSREEKARNQVKAALLVLQGIEHHWASGTPSMRAIAISEVRHTLAGAVTILMGGDANT